MDYSRAVMKLKSSNEVAAEVWKTNKDFGISIRNI